MHGLIGKKIGMTQVFDETGKVMPVTVVEAGPCVVTQVKTADKDGYDAVQVGFGARTAKHTTKPLQGHFAKAGTEPQRQLAEFAAVPGFEYRTGQRFTVAIFHPGDKVTVSGVSKGKGFAGVIRRHHFKRQPTTHGQSQYMRHPGSIGQSSDPSRVFKGVRMGGRLGGNRVTTKNLQVVRVDQETNRLFLCGAVPGANNGLITITK